MWFRRTPVHIDITFDKIGDTLWITMALHFFHPVSKRMITLATMDFMAKDVQCPIMAVLFWTLLFASVAKYVASAPHGELTDIFNPFFFVSDGQGSIWFGIRWSFGNKDGTKLLSNREQTCYFHFG
jgi:hypothetical protein